MRVLELAEDGTHLKVWISPGRRVVAVALRNKDAVLLGYGGPECGDICFWMAEGYNLDHGDRLSTTLGIGETSVFPIFCAAGPHFKKNYRTDPYYSSGRCHADCGGYFGHENAGTVRRCSCISDFGKLQLRLRIIF